MSGAERCADTSTITVTPPGPWWQVVDADVQTNGDLRSKVPIGLYFGLPGLGGFPGVPKFGGSSNLNYSNVSVKGWLANSLYAPPNNKVQNYAYFRRMVPDGTLNSVTTLAPIQVPSGGTPAFGYEWYEYDASAPGNAGQPLSLTASDLGGRKVILFVTGADVNIQGSITYTSGQGIFVVLTDHNINIDGNVGNAISPNFDLMGFFLADGNISTGVSASSLRLKGSVAAQGSLVLQRDLGGALNATTPSEVFEYDPVSAFLFPPKLSVEKTRWKEVAP